MSDEKRIPQSSAPACSALPFSATVSLPVVIRRCERTELRALEWFGAFTAHREIIEAAFAAQERGDNVMLVAVVGEAPIGQVWIDLKRGRSEQAAYVWALRVFPWLQGRGLGRQLLRAAEYVATEAGCRRVDIAVEPANVRALALYERIGYSRSGERREAYSYRSPDGRTHEIAADEILLRKPLPGSEPPPVMDVVVCESAPAPARTCSGRSRRRAGLDATRGS